MEIKLSRRTFYFGNLKWEIAETHDFKIDLVTHRDCTYCFSMLESFSCHTVWTVMRNFFFQFYSRLFTIFQSSLLFPLSTAVSQIDTGTKEMSGLIGDIIEYIFSKSCLTSGMHFLCEESASIYIAKKSRKKTFIFTAIHLFALRNVANVGGLEGKREN